MNTMTSNLSVFNTMAKTLDDQDLAAAIAILRTENKSRGERRSSKNRRSLAVGDKVEWNGRNGASSGVVKKVKTKKALVTEDTKKTCWDIPMSMLTKIS
jgi:putative ribosome biogenesis GTPase RsgA